MNEGRRNSTLQRILGPVKRGAEGGVLLIGVALAGVAAALAAPRATEPVGAPFALPLPLPDRAHLAALARDDRERAGGARRHALSFAVRSVGEMFRHVGAAEGKREGNAEAALYDLRALARRALRDEGATGLLALRAVQAELFVAACGAFVASGTPSPELGELGGDFPELARKSGWFDGKALVLTADELALLFRTRWNELTALGQATAFAATLDEHRERYALLLRHPAGDDAAARGARQLGYVTGIEKLDHDYPAAFARGVLLYRAGAYDAAAAAFRAHLAARPDGPWTLRARNHLLAALARTPDG
jgi:hypothetical protein